MHADPHAPLPSARKRTLLIAFDDFTARPPRGRAVTEYADQFGPPDSLSFVLRWRSPPIWRIMIQPLGKRAYSIVHRLWMSAVIAGYELSERLLIVRIDVRLGGVRWTCAARSHLPKLPFLTAKRL